MKIRVSNNSQIDWVRYVEMKYGIYLENDKNRLFCNKCNNNARYTSNTWFDANTKEILVILTCSFCGYEITAEELTQNL